MVILMEQSATARHEKLPENPFEAARSHKPEYPRAFSEAPNFYSFPADQARDSKLNVTACRFERQTGSNPSMMCPRCPSFEGDLSHESQFTPPAAAETNTCPADRGTMARIVVP
jgi:hypothetical protein